MSILDRLEGRWRLSREVRDHRAGHLLRFAGEARFDPDGQGLTCRESGIWLEAPWGRLKAERVYLWRAEGAGGVRVLFADGRDFHRFRGSGGTAESAHDCGCDRYEVRYVFDLPHLWEAVWRVTGPRKDYISATRFARA